MADEVLTPADAGGTGTPAPVATERVAEPSHRDWNAMAQNVRELNAAFKALTPVLASLAPTSAPAKNEPAAPAAAKTAGDGADTAALMARLAINEALDEFDGQLSREQRTLVKRLYAAEKPADVGSWLSATAESLGAAKKAAAPTTPSVGAPRAVDPGTPVGGSAGELPLDPALIPQSVVDSWTPKQAQDWYDRYRAKSGRFEHPFAKARNAERAGGGAAEAAKLIASALERVSK